MITKTFALEECKRIWTILSLDIQKDKTDIDGIEKYVYNCPCCQYVCDRLKHDGWSYYMKKDKHCTICPLKKIWPGNNCEDSLSPYVMWKIYRVEFSERPELAVKGAHEIADASDTELMFIYLKEMNE